MGMLGQQAPLGRRLGNAVFSYGRYLEKSFWPSPLAAIYPYANRKPIDVLIVGLALGAISVAAFRLAKIRPFLLVGWCWYLGTLVPVIGLVQVGVQSMADRYTYIPLIGIFIIAAWGAAEFTEDWPARNKAIAAAVVLAVCGWFAWRQVATWSSSEALYRHAVEAERNNFFALHGLGMVYWKERSRWNAGRESWMRPAAIRGHPELQVRSESPLAGDLEPAHRALGLLLAVRHQPKKALEQLDEAIHARPQQPEPYRHKAWILATSLDDNVRDGKKAVAVRRAGAPTVPRETARVLGYAGRRPGRGREVPGGRRSRRKKPCSRPARCGPTISCPASSSDWNCSSRACLTTPRRNTRRDCRTCKEQKKLLPDVLRNIMQWHLFGPRLHEKQYRHAIWSDS